MSLPDILTVQHVAERYGLRDPRAARKVMRDVGAFTVAGRMVVRADQLDAWERQQSNPRATRETTKVKRRAQTVRSQSEAPLQAGWWRTASGPHGE